MVNGHLNLVKIYSYKNLAITITILVLSAFASTHLVEKYVTTKIYLFHVTLLACLIRPIKSRPYFIKGSFGSVVTNLIKLFIFNPPIFL
jgi:hypothetical protein